MLSKALYLADSFAGVRVLILNLSCVPGDYAGFPGCGLLRLHSTYRHDLKIYASDEGRVQMTAAAFAKVLPLFWAPVSSAPLVLKYASSKGKPLVMGKPQSFPLSAGRAVLCYANSECPGLYWQSRVAARLCYL